MEVLVGGTAMSDPGSVRGFRPSSIVPYEEDCEARELVRLANLEKYVVRAKAGMPIFEEPTYVVFPSGGVADQVAGPSGM